MDCSPPGSSVHGILQTRILEWVAIPSPRDLSDPGIKPGSLALQANSLPSEPPGKYSNSASISNDQSTANKGAKEDIKHLKEVTGKI